MGITGFQKTGCFSTFVFGRIIAIYLEEITYKIRYTTPVRLRLSIWVVYYCTRTFRQFFIVARFAKARQAFPINTMCTIPVVAAGLTTDVTTTAHMRVKIKALAIAATHIGVTVAHYTTASNA